MHIVLRAVKESGKPLSCTFSRYTVKLDQHLLALTCFVSAGLFSGNLPVIQSVLAELSNPSNQAFAVSIYSLLWPFGNIVG